MHVQINMLCMYGWMHAWMDGIISEWMNERMNYSSYVSSKPRSSAESTYTEDNCALIGC